MNGTNPDRAPGAIPRSVESCAQEGRDDEQDCGTTSRPRRTNGDLIHVGELLTPLMKRLLDGES